MKLNEFVNPSNPAIIHLEFYDDLAAEDCDLVLQKFQILVKEQKMFVLALMASVTSIAPPFLGALMDCKKKLTEKGGALVLVGLNASIMENFMQLGADKVFHFSADVPAAMHRINWEKADGTQILRLTLPPNLQIIPAARRLLSGIARQKGYSSRDAFRIETLVDEIANNAIEHGASDQSDIYIEAKISRHKLELLVRNKTRLDKVGQLQEIIDSNRAVLRGHATRGRGLALIKLISKSLNVTIDKNGTCVSVTKNREDV